jgi:hypothetical protein
VGHTGGLRVQRGRRQQDGAGMWLWCWLKAKLTQGDTMDKDEGGGETASPAPATAAAAIVEVPWTRYQCRRQIWIFLGKYMNNDNQLSTHTTSKR